MANHFAQRQTDLQRPSVAESRPAQEMLKPIGRIVAISGSQVIAQVVDEGDLDRAALSQSLQVGALVKMRTPVSMVFGMVSGLSIPLPSTDGSGAETKLVELELIGECDDTQGLGERRFSRGVSTTPVLGDTIFVSSQDDLRLVYSPTSVSTIRIGTVHQDQSIPSVVVLNDLLGKHMAILGTTGCGKSCTVALILHAILDNYANGHIVVLDPHNEYTHSFKERAEVLGTENLQLPYWLLNFEELVEVVAAGDTRDWAAEIGILRDIIPTAKRNFADSRSEGYDLVTVDTPVPYHMSEVIRIIDDKMGKFDSQEKAGPHMRLKSRLNTLRSDQRFSFMFGSRVVRDNMAAILSRLFRVPVDGKPITIVDLSGLPSEVLNVVVSLLSRMTFDFALLSERAIPILLVCEEAHRYAPQDPDLGFQPTKRALSQIAKEGRKYGVSLCVVSQRPAELAPELLSQCNTIFAMRLSHQLDQQCVQSALQETSRGLMESLPSLGNAEAIVVGEGFPMPLRLCLDTLPDDRRPLSGTAAFSEKWRNAQHDADFIHQVIKRWRSLK